MNIDARAKKGEQIKVLCVKESIYYIMHKHKYSFQRAFIHSDGAPRYSDVSVCAD